MDKEEQEKQRRQGRLGDLIAEKFGGDKTAAGRAFGYRDGAYIGQMLRGERPISEKFIRKVESRHGCDSWFSLSTAAVAKEPSPTHLDKHQSVLGGTSSSLPYFASGAVIRVPWISRARLVEALWQTGDGVISEGEPLLIEAGRNIDPRTKAVRVWDDSLSPHLRIGDEVLVVPVAPSARPPFNAIVLAQIDSELPEFRIVETLADGTYNLRNTAPTGQVWNSKTHRVTLLARKAGTIHWDKTWT